MRPISEPPIFAPLDVPRLRGSDDGFLRDASGTMLPSNFSGETLARPLPRLPGTSRQPTAAGRDHGTRNRTPPRLP